MRGTMNQISTYATLLALAVTSATLVFGQEHDWALFPLASTGPGSKIPYLDLHSIARRGSESVSLSSLELPGISLMQEDGEAYGETQFQLYVGPRAQLVYWTAHAKDREIVSRATMHATEMHGRNYNCSISVEADKRPGETEISVVVYTRKGMRIRRDVIQLPVKVYGMVLLDKRGVVRSGVENQLVVKERKAQVALEVVWYFEEEMSAQELVDALQVSVEWLVEEKNSPRIEICSEEFDDEACIGRFKIRKKENLHFVIWPQLLDAQIRVDFSMAPYFFSNILYVSRETSDE